MLPLRGDAADLVDRAMDFLVVPGFSRIGYSIRRRMFHWRMPDLSGRKVMVTGASSGIGLALAIDLARCGAKVHMVCRDEEKGEAAVGEVRRTVGDKSTDQAELHLADLSGIHSIRDLVDQFTEVGGSLDVLIHNAGVMPPERKRTEEGFELTFATNVIGPYLLTELLLPYLRQGNSPRVVLMSSGGMYMTGFDLEDPQLDRRDYHPATFYAHTKRAEVMLAEAWQRAEPEGAVSFCSMHPGWVETPGMTAALPGFQRLTRPIGRDAHQGADTATWLAGASVEEAPGATFFQDRRPRTTERRPETVGSVADAARLRDLLAEMTGEGEKGCRGTPD